MKMFNNKYVVGFLDFYCFVENLAAKSKVNVGV
jgi:hypothetical protein